MKDTVPNRMCEQHIGYRTLRSSAVSATVTGGAASPLKKAMLPVALGKVAKQWHDVAQCNTYTFGALETNTQHTR